VGRYDNPTPPRYLAPVDSLKIPALRNRWGRGIAEDMYIMPVFSKMSTDSPTLSCKAQRSCGPQSKCNCYSKFVNVHLWYKWHVPSVRLPGCGYVGKVENENMYIYRLLSCLGLFTSCTSMSGCTYLINATMHTQIHACA